MVNCLKKINEINLFIASWEGHYDTVKLLIDANADVNIKTNNGFLALNVGQS